MSNPESEGQVDDSDAIRKNGMADKLREKLHKRMVDEGSSSDSANKFLDDKVDIIII